MDRKTVFLKDGDVTILCPFNQLKPCTTHCGIYTERSIEGITFKGCSIRAIAMRME